MMPVLQGWAKPDPFEWHKVKPYLLYVGMFVTTIYCNFKALEVSNVETLIVARSCVPVTVSFLDFTFLGRHVVQLDDGTIMLDQKSFWDTLHHVPMPYRE